MAAALAALLMGSASSAAEPTWPDRIEWAEDGPAAREHPSLMVFDETVVIYGGSGYAPQGAPLGDAWAFDLRERTWRALEVAGDAPDAAGSRRVAQPRGADHAYLFGGYGANFATNNDLHRVRLRGDSLVFERIEQIDPPPARALHAFAADPQTGALIVTHGVSAAGFFDDTWIGVFDGEGRVTWAALAAEARPGPRFGFACGFDADRGELLMLSGQTPPTQENQMPMAQGLWALDVRSDPPAWRRIEVADPPAGRRNPMYAFDDATDTLVVWCGTADARTNVPGLVTVSRDAQGEWRIAQWSDDAAPARRSSGVGFADPRGDRFFFGFGNSREGQYTDWVTLALPLAGANASAAPEPATEQAVEAAIREYVTAKYAGDDERVRSRAHHDIARRVVATGYRGHPSAEWVRPYDHDRLQFYGTSRNGTRRDDPERGRCEITIHDLETRSAAAVVVMEDVVDFLHLAHFDGRWLIVDSAVIILDENGAAPPAPTREGAAAIERTIRDYCLGFYEMNGPKVQATCHPILSKRTVERWSVDGGSDGAGFDYFRPITWEEIRLLGDAFNREFGFDPATARCGIEVFEIRGNIALAKLTGAVWFDYLQLMRINGEWTIVNILFEPLSAARSASP